MGHSQNKYIPALKYRVLTPFFDSVLRLTMQDTTFKLRMVKESDIKPNFRVLDLGCGTATLTILARRANTEATVVGMDGDPEVLKIAKAKTASLELQIPLVCGMSLELPHPDNCFDCVLSSLLFHHLTRENKIRTFKEAFRVLRPGGMLLVADFGTPGNAFMRLFSVIGQRFEETSDNLKGLLPLMAQDAGFCEVGEYARYGTIFGTLSLFKAQKP